MQFQQVKSVEGFTGHNQLPQDNKKKYIDPLGTYRHVGNGQ